MTPAPHVTLEQWRSLVAVVDAGGYAQAAELLHKSQSALTYAVQKLESQLEVKAFEIRGRKAVLTPTGQLLYRRARALIEEAEGVERAARAISAGWEAQIGLAVEILFPTWLLLECLDRFGVESPHTRIELIESVLGGTGEALTQGLADIAIGPQVPPGFSGEALLRFRGVLVAHPQHPLHRLGRKVTLRDLRAHRHVVVRDTGSRRDLRAVSVEVDRRWTVSNMSTSIQAVRMGYGFAWFPEDKIRDELRSGALEPLPMREGSVRFGDFYLILADPDGAGPGTRRLAAIIREGVAGERGKRRREAGKAESADAPLHASDR
jgi:DNA-binding transcriptional LysR family regulator